MLPLKGDADAVALFGRFSLSLGERLSSWLCCSSAHPLYQGTLETEGLDPKSTGLLSLKSHWILTGEQMVHGVNLHFSVKWKMS